LTLSAKRLTKI